MVGVVGGELFAAQRGDADLIATTAAQTRDWTALARFVNRSYNRMDKLYTGGGARAAQRALFKQIRGEADTIQLRTGSEWEHEEFSREMNNAFFFRYYDYTNHYPLSLKVCRQTKSLTRAMKRYKRAGRTGAIQQLKDYLS